MGIADYMGSEVGNGNNGKYLYLGRWREMNTEEGERRLN